VAWRFTCAHSVAAACLCESFEQLSQQGKAILKQDQQQIEAEARRDMPVSKRTAHRNELHHASLAGKGGLLLDFSNVNEEDKPSETSSSTSASTSPKASEKSAAEWNLLDCRSWLLDASRRIAQQWTEERIKLGAASKNIPHGSVDELEGKLVEHSITLCEQLEYELQSLSKTKETNVQRVITPRVTDMSKLGIKWQHSHERGSGGKGGVGGSGSQGGFSGPRRTAGQILLLKTANKLGSILNDPIAGEAISRELRNVIGQQETRKRQLRLEESSRQRMLQMKRKPYLQARVQS
jgi:hypothetical protein